ncbi:PucR family transcriptional regulator [Microbacterium marinilacus]|uniref:Helix-turn-helix domain-containing protein n=1 Tax=Microbacterium marinilacus TaxID=415209 RepID=A0ABP7BFA3_9MICO|nr:PucR family transcriptional regulator [Microbacterium marinilacus]MBY0689560.1 helix-turn-helix domain-containing protein [Microbacterium marinilacus]
MLGSFPGPPRASGRARRPEQHARALPTLARVLEELGSTFLSDLAPVPDPERRVGGVVVYDPLDDQAVADGAVVLGVGLAGGSALRAVLADAGDRNASAIVLREPVELDEASIAAAGQHGIALLGLTRGASWMQLSAMVQALLAERDDDQPQDAIGGLPGGDLFTLANAIAALLDAPITIEDRNSRVLAFSARQDEADPQRIETILERQVPERYARMLTETGFFKRLYSSDVPEYVQLRLDGTDLKARCAIAVRAGGEILGSIWAAVPGELTAERTAAMRDAARVVALHLLSLRAGADVERRLRADLLSTALEGGDGAVYALERLGMDAQPVVVLAAEVIDGQDDGLDGAGDRQAQRQRLADAIAMHLAAVHPQASAALLGRTIYGLLPVRAADAGEAQAARLATDFLARIGSRTPVLIGIGRVATGPRGVVRSREGAERALRVQVEHAQTERGEATSRVALFSDVHVESLLLELRDRVSAGGEQATGAVARLLEHDRANDTRFVETLRAWLDHLGDVSSAAEALHIHPNTFRYRLRRLAEVGEMDLADPEARFSAQLQLRIIPDLVQRRS